MLKAHWEVYIIQSKSGKLYTGITTDIKRRFQEHVRKERGARFFHFSQAHRIVFRETFSSRSEASRREYAIKQMQRDEKLALIQSYNLRRLK